MPFCHIRLSAPKPSKLPTVLNTIGDHIRKRRLELGLLQREVADRLSVKVDTILNWEHNRTAPTLRCLPGVIAFLGYDPSDDNPRTLGEKLMKYGKSCGMSQKEMASRIGIDATTLSRLERDKGRCFDTVLKKVHDFLNTHE
ncbi:MAG: transcriptional regulator [Ignavibacteriales bacterium]|nr:transcriptional regulator [Ignavibacteriales bacterium]